MTVDLEPVIQEAWRAIPAVVLSLLAFGFKRIAMRFHHLFVRIDELEEMEKKRDEEVRRLINDKNNEHMELRREIERLRAQLGEKCG